MITVFVTNDRGDKVASLVIVRSKLHTRTVKLRTRTVCVDQARDVIEFCRNLDPSEGYTMLEVLDVMHLSRLNSTVADSIRTDRSPVSWSEFEEALLRFTHPDFPELSSTVIKGDHYEVTHAHLP